jgi:hypothetical protein
MDAVRRFPPISSSSLCPHRRRAITRRRSALVVRRGPGRRRAGRFVQLRKESFPGGLLPPAACPTPSRP